MTSTCDHIIKEYRKLIPNELLHLLEALPYKYDWNWDILSLNPNITPEILDKHHNMPWNYEFVSQNENITIDYVKNNLDKAWNWYYLSANPSIRLQDVIDNPDLPWDYNGLSLNPDITWEIIVNSQELPWNYYLYTRNKNLTYDIVLANPNLPWIWTEVPYENTIPQEIIQRILDFDTVMNNYASYGRSANAPSRLIKAKDPSLIIKYPDILWDMYDLAEKVEWNFIARHVNLDWSWRTISRKNPHITIDIIRDNLHLPWDWWMLCSNSVITFDIIKANPDLPWQIQGFTLNPNITIDVIRENLNIPWDWYTLCTNIAITPAIIKENSDLPWQVQGFSQNPNLTAELVINNPDNRIISYPLDGGNYEEWDFDHVSINLFTYDPRVISRLCQELIDIRKEELANLQLMVEDMRYRPGGRGYLEAQNRFTQYQK
jgi:hypothetical protein